MRMPYGFLLLALAVPAFAGVSSPVVTQPSPLGQITVSGDGSVKLVPDEMNWTISITTTDATLAKAKARHDASLAEVLELAHSLDLAVRDLQTGGIRFDRQQEDDGGNGVPPHWVFVCSTQITFTLTDFSRYGPIVDRLSTLDGAQVEQVGYDSSQTKAARLSSLARAVANARAKADALAAAAHGQAGDPVSIDESGAVSPRPLFAPVARSMTALASHTPAPVPGDIEVDSSVTVTYRLLPGK
jgi:uncharacterized protein YggE